MWVTTTRLEPIAQSDVASAVQTACPVSFIGYINGKYYYVCQKCNDCPQQLILSSTVTHRIDLLCFECDDESGCTDPFVGRRVQGVPDLIFGSTEGIERPLGLQSERSTQGSRSTLELGENVSLVSEHVATLKCEGKTRLLRLFVVKVRMDERWRSRGLVDMADRIVAFGQEAAGPIPDDAVEAKCVMSADHYHRVQLPGVKVDFEVTTCQER